MEPLIGNESMAKKNNARFDTPVRIVVIHRRYRLADPDGLSIKAALDGIVAAGILADDSAKEIKSIQHVQKKIKKPELESTLFVIEPV